MIQPDQKKIDGLIDVYVILQDAKTRDFVVGFSDLGNTDEFSTEMLEWRLGR